MHRRSSRHAGKVSSVKKRLVRSSPIFVPYRVFSVARLCISIFGRGLIAAFLIMTLMSDAYRVSGGPDRWRTRPASSRLESGIGPTWRVVEPIKNKSDSSPSSLALSLFSFFFCLSVSLCQNGLVPDVDTDRRARVPCSRLMREKGLKETRPLRVSLYFIERAWCLLRDVFRRLLNPADVSTYFFRASLKASLKLTITQSATTIVNQRARNPQGRVDRGYSQSDLKFGIHFFFARFNTYNEFSQKSMNIFYLF